MCQVTSVGQIVCQTVSGNQSGSGSVLVCPVTTLDKSVSVLGNQFG